MNNIPVVIVCGGQGTRMRGSTTQKKELVEIGGKPIIWHVMRIFSTYHCSKFVLTLGYGADQIRRYFMEYEWMTRNMTLQIGNSEPELSPQQFEQMVGHPPWEVSLIDTGLMTEKAGRILKVADYLTEERFFVAYGDDVSDVNLASLINFHRSHGKMATITAVQINLQYGIVEADGNGRVTGFQERPKLPYWINGGFMLFERDVLDIIQKNNFQDLETEVLPYLANHDNLMIYRHSGFWQSMNTMKDTMTLERIWQQNPPWKVWED